MVIAPKSHPVIYSRLVKASVVTTLIGMMGAALCWAALIEKPVTDIDPATFWFHVTGLDLGLEDPHNARGSFYQPRDDWFISYVQGQQLYRVQATDAIAFFPKVAERLRNAPPGVLGQDVENGFRSWASTGAGPDDAAGFLAHVREAHLARVKTFSEDLYEELRTEDDFSERWRRANRYHWNVLFEFFFLAGLILFADWPWLRGCGRVHSAIHIFLLPILFCLPYWLGYAALTFSSASSGGILYPTLLSFFPRLGCSRSTRPS